jgi:hypothetical protein
MAGRPRSTAGTPRHSARMGPAIRRDNSIRRKSCQQAAHGCHRQRPGQAGQGRDECRANVCRACRAGYPECPSRKGPARAETAQLEQPPCGAARPADDPRGVLPEVAGPVRGGYDFPLELGQRAPQGLRVLVRPVPDRCSSRPAHVQHESNSRCSRRSRAATRRVHPRQLPTARGYFRRLTPPSKEPSIMAAGVPTARSVVPSCWLLGSPGRPGPIREPVRPGSRHAEQAVLTTPGQVRRACSAPRR